jgi:hypothetical protein
VLAVAAVIFDVLVKFSVFRSLILPLLARLLLVGIIKRISVIFIRSLLCLLSWVLVKLLLLGSLGTRAVVSLLDVWVRENVVGFSYLFKFFSHCLRLSSCVWVVLFCQFVKFEFYIVRSR